MARNEIKVKRVDLGYSIDYNLEEIVEKMVQLGERNFTSDRSYDVTVSEDNVIAGRVAVAVKIEFKKVSKPIDEYMKVVEEKASGE